MGLLDAQLVLGEEHPVHVVWPQAASARVGKDRLTIVLAQHPGSTSVQHLYGGARQGNGAGCAGLGHRLTVQSSDAYLSVGRVAAGLDQGGGHANERDVGIQVEVGPLQGQRLADAHPGGQE
jgi:hypothetical protein